MGDHRHDVFMAKAYRRLDFVSESSVSAVAKVIDLLEN